MIQIGIIGAKNSGKTTLIEAMLGQLSKMGIAATTIKHTGHDHSFDTPGKDSWRHRQAGAKATLAISQTSAAIFFDPTPENISAAINLLEAQASLCLVEGDKSSERPRILLTRKMEPAELLPLTNVIATYGNNQVDDALPNFEFDNLKGLAEFFVEKFSLRTRECYDAD